MKIEQALKISSLMDQWMELQVSSQFEAIKLDTAAGKLPLFHQWVNGKSVSAGYTIRKHGEEAYHFLFIDWHRKGNYYLVLYLENKSTTAAEIQHVEEDGGSLWWTYNPLKRDGKNAERKTYFISRFGSPRVTIPLPKSPNQVDSFLQALFTLCRNRIMADRAANVFTEI
ncbi:hypothetical protein [Falsibacillus pallidus]|uniref:Uncharacterized protein n=1 Tax=Falsibacillus pallidus TaxID=493781 RepID=A0A370GDZ2_9BACI|nr:hypothetical protein [Falsibacillus pallidus]RDI41901.1 hypothetical protein DFR59_10660 [Falsibacillus pallidus]